MSATFFAASPSGLRLAGALLILSSARAPWIQVGTDIDGEAADDESGSAVATNADGTIVAIGAHLNDGTGINAGHVRVYEYSSSTWTQLALQKNQP